MRKFLGLLFAAVLILTGCGTETPEEGIKETLTNWINAVCRKDFEKANSYLTPYAQQIFNTWVPILGVSFQYNFYKMCKGSKKHEVNILYIRSLDNSGTLYEANFEIIFSDSPKYNDVFNFIKTNHGWKIHVLKK